MKYSESETLRESLEIVIERLRADANAATAIACRTATNPANARTLHLLARRNDRAATLLQEHADNLAEVSQ